MRRRLVGIAVFLLVGTYFVAAGLDNPQNDPPEAEVVAADSLIQPAENGSYLWPYTSRSESVEGRTLAINLLIHAPAEDAKLALIDRSGLEWEETPEDEEDVEADTYEISLDDAGLEWDDAHGSTRYTYFDDSENGGTAAWADESYQLHTGTYLGTRYHIRAYESPDERVTAVQIHQEYWDWFRLRHTVTDIDNAAGTLEDDFIEQPFVSEVRREHHGLDGGWSDGWISVVELGAALLAVGGVLGRDTRTAIERVARDLGRWGRHNRHAFILGGALIGLFLGVRTVGVALEATLGGVSPKVFAGLLYPVLAVGIPAATVVFSRWIDAATAFYVPVVALGVAFVLDFGALGLTWIPIRLALHRIGLLVALGLLAYGVARGRDSADRHPLAVVGAVGWVIGLLMPLLGML
ncbi:hypothetical protein ACNS7O_08680 [Haloferacaceae archaeon DSL9]